MGTGVAELVMLDGPESAYGAQVRPGRGVNLKFYGVSREGREWDVCVPDLLKKIWWGRGTGPCQTRT